MIPPLIADMEPNCWRHHLVAMFKINASGIMVPPCNRIWKIDVVPPGGLICNKCLVAKKGINKSGGSIWDKSKWDILSFGHNWVRSASGNIYFWYQQNMCKSLASQNWSHTNEIEEAPWNKSHEVSNLSILWNTNTKKVTCMIFNNFQIYSTS